jgi:hypothetical protein
LIFNFSYSTMAVYMGGGGTGGVVGGYGGWGGGRAVHNLYILQWHILTTEHQPEMVPCSALRAPP